MDNGISVAYLIQPLDTYCQWWIISENNGTMPEKVSYANLPDLIVTLNRQNKVIHNYIICPWENALSGYLEDIKEKIGDSIELEVNPI